MIHGQIKQTIAEALRFLDLTQVEFGVEHPGDERHGDYSTNVAMILAKQVGKNPRELAQNISEVVQKNSFDSIERVEVAGSGFINFYLSEQFLTSETQVVLDLGEKYGQSKSLDGKRILVEYTDPNPFKEFHVGHLYSNIVGESIARLLQANGATVWRGDYFGDVGMHVAKALWGILQYTVLSSRESGETKEVKTLIAELEQKPLKERIEFFGKAYSMGATAYEEDEAAKEEMKQINFLAFRAAQDVVLPQHNKSKEVDYDQFIQPSKYTFEDIKALYAQGRAWSLEYFETIYARLGTKFDGYYPESMTGEYGYGMVMDGLSKGIFEKGEGGAVIFPGEKFGLHNRVFINALGLPTYETKDFGNAVAKKHDFDYDESVIVTGNEINEYFDVVLEAMRQYKPELGNVTRHIGHGMVKLPEGKMSSRTGKIIRGEDVLNEAKSRVVALMEERNLEAGRRESGDGGEQVSDDQESMIDTTNKTGENGIASEALVMTAEQVAQAAIKYAFLKQGIGKDISFDFDSSLSFEGNSGPYIQYTCVRAKSVLAKTDMKYWVSGSEHLALNDEELALLRWVYRYPEVIAQAAGEFAPHGVAGYLYELCGRFNGFYNKHTVLQSEGEKRRLRLTLTAVVVQILTNGLAVLGIAVPEKM